MAESTQAEPIELSVNQLRILNFIGDYVAHKGYSPTIEEIRVGLGLSGKSLVHYHLRRLRAARRITWKPRKSRTLRQGA